MNEQHWQRLNDIFHAATALPPEQRDALLERSCAGDSELRTQAERLIRAHERSGRFIDTPAIAIAGLWPDAAEEQIAAAGTRFGRYRILSELGHGGMGTVYLAERDDGQYEQRVALKLIRRGMDVDLVLQRFRAERQILASLEHANIARILDGGTSDDDRPFFVMEYIDGEPIDRYANSRNLSVAERLELFLQVCDAVAYAHRHRIIHRDIKPVNVLVTPEGVPKLLDFGIAKALDTDAAGETVSLTGLRLLTPDYASPEQVDGRSATAASDVYSLGVVLYELLTGCSPYHPGSRDPLTMAELVRTTQPARPSAATAPLTRRQIRGDLDTIVLTALRKEPERRYATVEDFAQDIRRHLDNMPIQARPESVVYRARKFVRRNRTAVITAVAAVVVTSLLATSLIVLGAPDPAEPSLLATGALTPRDRILIAPLTDRMGDTLLTAAVGEALRIDVAQSPFMQVLTPLQIRSALERMQIAGDATLNDSLAREIALREGAKAVVTGTLARVGGAYTINLQLMSVERGEALAAVRETATDSTRLLAAVDRASKALRHRLGESIRDLRDMPTLEQVTTPSLHALRKYSVGYRHYVNGDRPRAIALFSEAVAADTGFASAHSAMAYAYAALDEPGRYSAALDHAVANRDRLPLLQRQMLLASRAYAAGDYATTIAEYERLLERYPNHVSALNNLALAYRDARQPGEAERLWHRAIELDSTISVLYFGLHSAQVFRGDVAQARRTLDIVGRRFPDNTILPVVEVQDAAARRDWDAAERLALANFALKNGDTLQLVDAYEQLAGIAMTQGRLRDAQEYWRSQLEMSAASASWGRRLFAAQQLGYIELRYRDRPAAARAVVADALARVPLDSILPADRPYDELARFHAATGDLPRARSFLALADDNDRQLGRSRTGERAWTRGVIALVEGRIREAQAQLRQSADSHWCAICPLPDLARAHEASGDLDAARRTYESYLVTPWLWRYENDAIELGQVMTRLGELYEARGETDRAAGVYAELLETWGRADGEAALRAADIGNRLERLTASRR